MSVLAAVPRTRRITIGYWLVIGSLNCIWLLVTTVSPPALEWWVDMAQPLTNFVVRLVPAIQQVPAAAATAEQAARISVVQNVLAVNWLGVFLFLLVGAVSAIDELIKKPAERMKLLRENIEKTGRDAQSVWGVTLLTFGVLMLILYPEIAFRYEWPKLYRGNFMVPWLAFFLVLLGNAGIFLVLSTATILGSSENE